MKVLKTIFNVLLVFVFIVSMSWAQSILGSVFYDVVKEKFFLATADPSVVETTARIMSIFSSYFIVISIGYPFVVTVRKEFKAKEGGTKHE